MSPLRTMRPKGTEDLVFQNRNLIFGVQKNGVKGHKRREKIADWANFLFITLVYKLNGLSFDISFISFLNQCFSV